VGGITIRISICSIDARCSICNWGRRRPVVDHRRLVQNEGLTAHTVMLLCPELSVFLSVGLHLPVILSACLLRCHRFIIILTYILSPLKR